MIDSDQVTDVMRFLICQKLQRSKLQQTKRQQRTQCRKINKLDKLVIGIEKKTDTVETICRRNNIEVIDIPKSISENELPRNVIELCRELVLVVNFKEDHGYQGLRVTAYDCNETKATS